MARFRSATALCLGVLAWALLSSASSFAQAAPNQAAPAQAAPAQAAPTQAAPLEGNPQRGRAISYTCLGCHGIEGYRNAYPNYEVPELKGQYPEYIVAALQEYKSGQRAHTTMHAQASDLSAQDMADIAVFFAGKPLQRGTAQASARTPPRAAAVCVACHGTDGIGVAPTYPDIAGQHPDYIAQALREYQNGTRKHPIMTAMAAQLKPADIEAVAEFYGSLRPSLRTLPRPYTFLSVGSPAQ